MKKIACLLLLIFTLVQLAPAVQAFFTHTTSIFIADEEKGEEKISTKEIKDKKDFAGHNFLSTDHSAKINTAFHLSENIQPSPCLEKLTPPPNFC